MIELWDIWLPHENKIVTLRADDLNSTRGKPLRVVDWAGPESGPYSILSFMDVPSNSMPLAPAAQWMDLHVSMNKIMRKLIDQAERQKENLLYEGEAEEDAARITQSADGDSIRVDNAMGTQIAKFGGPDQTNLGIFMQLRDLFTYLGGNLDALGGLSPQSETLGQDELITRSASQRMADMQTRTTEFSANVLDAIGFYIWNDPTIDRSFEKQITSAGRTRSFIFSAEKKEGDWADYNIEIEPYSMTHTTPSMRLQSMMNMLERVILPTLSITQAQGVEMNIMDMVKQMSKDANIPEFGDFMTESGGGLGFDERGEITEDDQPLKPPVTTRHSVRTNRPGASAGSKSMLAQTLMAGGNNNPDQNASLGRPTG